MARIGTEERGKTVTTDKARQGRRGHQVLMLLVVSLALALAAWGIAEVYGSMIAPVEVDTQTTAPAG
jgi:hypothetical protein